MRAIDYKLGVDRKCPDCPIIFKAHSAAAKRCPNCRKAWRNTYKKALYVKKTTNGFTKGERFEVSGLAFNDDRPGRATLMKIIRCKGGPLYKLKAIDGRIAIARSEELTRISKTT